MVFNLFTSKLSIEWNHATLWRSYRLCQKEAVSCISSCWLGDADFAKRFACLLWKTSIQLNTIGRDLWDTLIGFFIGTSQPLWVLGWNNLVSDSHCQKLKMMSWKQFFISEHKDLKEPSGLCHSIVTGKACLIHSKQESIRNPWLRSSSCCWKWSSPQRENTAHYITDSRRLFRCWRADLVELDNTEVNFKSFERRLLADRIYISYADLLPVLDEPAKRRILPCRFSRFCSTADERFYRWRWLRKPLTVWLLNWLVTTMTSWFEAKDGESDEDRWFSWPFLWWSLKWWS